jgi:hypothetical protein
MDSKFQRHNPPLITLLREMVMYLTLWSIRISDSGLTVSDILDLDHLPVVFHVLDRVKTKNPSEPVEIFTDWEWFYSPASDLISPRVEINSEEEVDEVTRDFTVSIALAYKLSTSKVSLLDINNHDLPGLESIRVLSLAAYDCSSD